MFLIAEMDFRKYWCMIFSFSVQILFIDTATDFAEIKSTDGNIIIRSAQDKNISFLTDGQCDVYINGVSFANAVQKILKVDTVMKDYETILEENVNRLKVLHKKTLHSIDWSLIVLKSRIKTMKLSRFNPNLAQSLKLEVADIRSSVSKLKSLISKNECASSPCKNGGTCQNFVSGYHCSCPSGWEGINCEEDVNECILFNSTDLGCQNRGICRNKPGSYDCICTDGWHGLHCMTKSNGCFSGPAFDICGHGICIPGNNELGRRCICEQGWTKLNENEPCIFDVDECKDENPVCSKDPPVSCTNTPGSFRCGTCPAGFTGNGQYCTDINECELFNGGCSVNPVVQCINTPGSRRCGSCPIGYSGDGTTCTYRGVCAINNGNCSPLATCIEYPSISQTYSECRCPPGYTGNGYGPRGCLPSTTNACSSKPCKFGTCTPDANEIGGFKCHCQNNYFGKYCNHGIEMCFINPCRNGGSCVNVNSTSYSCTCPPGFSGAQCELTPHECGDLLLEDSGEIRYSTSSSSYSTCSWTIQTAQNKVLNISFSQFSVGNDDDCTNDWLQITDGLLNNHRLGKFCGNKLPANGAILSTKNIVKISFQSRNRTSSFKLKWNSVHPKCHEILNLTANPTGIIKSPDWPYHYPLNRDCVWLLQAPVGRSIKLTFFSFDIGNDTDCSGDFLEVSSSFVEGKDILAKRCGGQTSPPIISEIPELRIYFHSDKRNNYPGFQIEYSLQPACGMLRKDSKGVLASPNVTKDLICFYQIQHNLELKIKLTFNTISLSKSERCVDEYVSLYEGYNTSAPLIGRYCGETSPSVYISDSSVISIKYKKTQASSYFSISYEAVCEEIFEDPSGYIRSVGYPSTLPVGLTCIYLIKQQPGSTIVLKISSDIDYSDYKLCDSPFFEVRDGDNANATYIYSSDEFYDDYDDAIIRSSSNALWIKVSSDSRECSSNFMAQYNTTLNSGCGSLLRNQSGSIIFSNEKNVNRNCKWSLEAPSGFFIQLYVTLFDFAKSHNCSLSRVSVYEKNYYSKDAELIGSYCGKRIPPLILIPSNLATVAIISSRVWKEQEFSANYIFLNETKVCGGNLFSKTGTIKSPHYPKPYPPSSDCVWTITVDSQRQIELKTSVFKTRGPCTLEYLEIRNGGSAFSPLIGRFCGIKIPKIIRSHTNQLYLHLVSSYVSIDTSKFLFTWETTTIGCGGTLTSAFGALASPNYPEPYHAITDCQWSIIVSQGSTIQLVFLDLDLESKIYYKKCTMNFIEIYDGSTDAGKSLGKFCGTQFPQNLMSTNRRMDIYFKTVSSNEGRGFNLHYRTICSNNFTGYGGVIESPSFPESHPVLQQCTWYIKVTRKNTVNITFSHLDLEEKIYHESPFFTLKQGVHLNYLQIYYIKLDDNLLEEKVLYRSYMGSSSPESITVPADHVMVTYKSETNLIGNGFRLEWVVNGCGGHLNKPGNIASPNYPKKYPDDIACEWLIEAPVGKSILLKFNAVDVEKQNMCPYDVIKVYNGPDSNYPLLGSLCHMEKQVTFTSNGHLMHVSFVSDSSYAGKGFSADFEFINSKCGGELIAPSGEISSPNYPKNFNVGDFCEWLITVEENHVIELKFQTVDLISSAYCKKNYVKIYDGPSTRSSLLATICETTIQSFTSTSNKMLVVFKSDKSISKPFWGNMDDPDLFTSKGFLASYSKACGARIVASDVSGILKFKPYSMAHTTLNDRCAWTIVAPRTDQKVALTTTRLHIRYMGEDTQNGLAVYGGESKRSPLISKQLTNKLPPTIVSDGPALHVEITGEVDFSAIYHVFGENCGGSLTGLNGMFKPIGTSCEWTIQVAPGNEISVSFKEFNLPQSKNCALDYLEIRNKNATGFLKGIYCGNTIPKDLTHLGSLWIYYKIERANNSFGSKPVGFLAEYATSTYVEVTGYKGEIASPLYPESFASSLLFKWKISVPGNSRIQLQFEDFETENFDEEYCLTPYLKVFDGENNEAPELGMFCGHKKPDPLESSSNTLFLEADMDSSRLENRFFMKWRRIYSRYVPLNKTCGSEDIVDIRKIHRFNLTSPGYPNGYGTNLQCVWNFQTESANSLRVKVNYLSLGYSVYCFQDYVKLTSDDLNSKFCHRSQMRTYNASRTLKVTFITNSYFNGSGFAVEIFEGCGGIMKESSGVITFDKNSPRDWTCKWKINVNAGRRISIQFMTFNTNSTNRCDNSITLKNGLNATSPNLGNGKYCGKPPNLETSGNNLYIEFNGNPNYTEFKAVYREVLYNCGGSFTLSDKLKNMEIMSPNHPSQSEPFIECYWMIRSPPGTYLQVDFIGKFDFHHNSNCDMEAVELRDGGTHLSPLINKFCKKSPDTQYTTDNILFVEYYTKAKEPGDGFLANVSIASCGGTYKSSDGSINWKWSPGKPLVNTNCTWNIIAPIYDSLYFEITFEGLMMNTYTCMTNGNFSVYEIINTPIGSKKKKLLTHMCDSSQKKKISSASNRVVIEYTNIMSKFKYTYPISISIKYNITGKDCIYTMNTEFGEIKSPNYPNLDYFKGYCVWNINVPRERRITVNITDFDLEKYSATSKDGQSVVFLDYGEYFMDEYYYNSSKRIYKSSGNVLQIIFLSEQSTTHRGFKAYYTSEEESVCDQDFSAQSGQFYRLTNNQRYVCVYKNNRKMPINRTLALSINSTLNYKADKKSSLFGKSSISVETESYGKYTFGESLFSSDRPLTRTAIVRSAYPETFLEIQMKDSEGNFSVYYEYYPCGGLIENVTGSISSPDFPKRYNDRLECSWVIELPVIERIKLNFLSMNLGENCEKSYIDVYNGKYRTSPRIGRFCNTNKPELIVSQKSNLLIEYHKDEGAFGVGFNATFDTFTEGCGGTITEKYKFIETPNYPNDYPQNAECLWTIVAPEGSHMVLSSVGRFQLEASDGCQNDFIEIFDWRYEKWVKINRWCGRLPPYHVTSKGNKMLVVFRSNDKISGSGFQMKWQMKCGGSFMASTEKQYITSPGYPQKYDNNLICSYTIFGRNKIIVEFEDFALEGDYPTCKNDNVTSLTSQGQQTYCGLAKPPKIEGRSSIFIKFKTDVWVVDTGFKFFFKSDNCGETVTEPKTISKTPTTSRRSYFRESCLWNITAPMNKTIMIKFTNYSEVSTYLSCISTGIEVHDGTNFINLLAKICGAQNIRIPVLTTTSNNALISSLSKFDRGDISFTAEIYFSPGPEEGCGGTFKLNKTKVIQPPKNYTNADCQWKFEVEDGFKLEFKIESLKLPDGCEKTFEHGTKNCTCSFVEMRDGSGPFSEEIDQFCSNTSYSQLYRTSWKFGFLRFYTETNYNQDTFKISVRPIPDICGRGDYIAEKTVHTITSPGYPNSYPPNIKCRWTLKKLNYRQTIIVRFIEINLTNSTNHKDNNTCTSDRVELEEGTNRRSFYGGRGKIISSKQTYNSYRINKGAVMQFCGEETKQFSIIGNNAALILGFISTSNPKKGRGFKIEYFLSGCSTNFTQDSGTIHVSQDNSTECMVYITSSQNTTLSLYFYSLWQAYRNNCSLEALEVYEGHSKQSSRLLRHCGHLSPNPIFASTNKLLIILSHSIRYTASSLEATFMASSNGVGCGGKIYDQYGAISSPFYPNNYTNDAICTWEINVPVGAHIRADFMNFRITGPCEVNYLKVATYQNGNVNQRTFCATDRISQLSSDNKLVLTYKSSSQNTGVGWLMKFRRVASKYTLMSPTLLRPRIG